MQLTLEASHPAFWNNLLLLQFDAEAQSKKYNVEFSPSMFRRTNAKGMEVILYFLFCKLSPSKAKAVLAYPRFPKLCLSCVKSASVLSPIFSLSVCLSPLSLYHSCTRFMHLYGCGPCLRCCLKGTISS